MTSPVPLGRLGFLYQGHPPLFPGYKPEKGFDCDADIVIARIEAQAPNGYEAVMTESRMPARFFEARARNADGTVLKMGTGSGEEAGILLHDLCQTLARAEAGLDEPDKPGAWRRKKKFRQQPDGAQTEVFCSRVGPCRIDVADTSNVLGDRPGVTLYVQDLALALRVGQAISEGMLTVEVACDCVTG